MIRQPPAAVPAAMVSEQTTLTHTATAKTGVCRKCNAAGSRSSTPCWVAVQSVRAMMPIVFWASSVPWPRPSTRAGQLQPSEGSIDAVRPAVAQDEHQCAHHQETQHQAHQRRDDHRQHDLGQQSL